MCPSTKATKPNKRARISFHIFKSKCKQSSCNNGLREIHFVHWMFVCLFAYFCLQIFFSSWLNRFKHSFESTFGAIFFFFIFFFFVFLCNIKHTGRDINTVQKRYCQTKRCVNVIHAHLYSITVYIHSLIQARAHHIRARISHRSNVTAIISHRVKSKFRIFLFKVYNEWQRTNSVVSIKHNYLSCTITRIDAIPMEIYWLKRTNVKIIKIIFNLRGFLPPLFRCQPFFGLPKYTNHLFNVGLSPHQRCGGFRVVKTHRLNLFLTPYKLQYFFVVSKISSTPILLLNGRFFNGFFSRLDCKFCRRFSLCLIKCSISVHTKNRPK